MIINGLGRRLEQQRLLMKLTRKEVSAATGLSVSAISNTSNKFLYYTPKFNPIFENSRKL